MANQPHDKSGKSCRCGKVYTKASATLTVSHREKNLIIKECVCCDCYIKIKEGQNAAISKNNVGEAHNL